MTVKGRRSSATPLCFKLALLAIAAFGTAWLLTRQLDHAWRALPYFALLACPLMHLFHRRPHGRA